MAQNQTHPPYCTLEVRATNPERRIPQPFPPTPPSLFHFPTFAAGNQTLPPFLPHGKRKHWQKGVEIPDLVTVILPLYLLFPGWALGAGC